MGSLRVKVAFTALLLICFASAVPWAKPADSPEDTTAIKQLFDNFNTAFNNHDAHGCAMDFTANADFINVAGVTTHGSAEVEQHLAPLFAGRLKNAHREVKFREIKFLRPDVATIDSDYEMSGVATASGGTAPPAKGIYDWIVTKQDGKWLIAVWHESNLPMPAAPARGSGH